MERSRNQGLTADILFVGMTRPVMLFGVTYSAMIFNLVLTIEAFIVTKDLAWLLAFVPIHALLYLVCLYEPRFFDLLQSSGVVRARHRSSPATLPSGAPPRAARSRSTCPTDAVGAARFRASSCSRETAWPRSCATKPPCVARRAPPR
jgi:type IV secretory pathway VirB3-like protein